jgi:tetratricopeptide (TPR) repeat protein
LYRREKYREALPVYRESESAQYVETSVYQQGLCYYYLGSYDTAKGLLERSVAMDSTNVGAWYNLGLTMMNLADYPAAVACFECAIRHSRSEIITSSYDRIGVSHYELGRRTAALKAFRKSIDENPKNPRAHYDLGVLYENLMHDQPNAIECYRAVVRIGEPSDEKESLYYKAQERLRLLGATSKR